MGQLVCGLLLLGFLQVTHSSSVPPLLGCRGVSTEMDNVDTTLLVSSWSELRDLLAGHDKPVAVRLDPSTGFEADSTIQLHDGVSILGGTCSHEKTGVVDTSRTRIACNMGDAGGPAFNVTAKENGKGVRICGVQLEDCKGSAIRVHGASTVDSPGPSSGLRIFNSKFVRNRHQDGNGGDLSVSHARLDICGCQFLHSFAVQGGSLALVQSIATITSSVFVNSSASSLGAAVKSDQGAFEAVGCTFEDARGGSALLATLPSKFVLRSCHFKRCTGGAQSGALTLRYNGAQDPLQASLENVTFAHCQGGRHAGAVYAESAEGELPLLLVKDSHFTGCQASWNGGGIMSQIPVTVVNTSFYHNQAGLLGGAIHLNSKAAFNCKDCTFWNNSAAVGGALSASDADPSALMISVTRSKFLFNSALQGGAIDMKGSLNCTDVVFERNTAGKGGALCLASEKDETPVSKLDRCQFLSNGAVSEGGGVVVNSQADVVFFRSKWEGNAAGSTGAGLALGQHNGSMNLVSCSFSSNRVASGGGGALSVAQHAQSAITMVDTTFKGNQAIQGGAVQLAAGNITARATYFTNNTAQVGGALIAYAQTRFRCERCNLVANYAEDGSGGAVAAVQATIVLTRSRVAGNQAVGWGSTVDFLGLQPTGVGGGLYGIESLFSLRACVLADNVGDVNGGAVALLDGKLAADSSSFQSNRAGKVGGALLLVDTACKGFKHHDVHSTTFVSNTAAFGGALAYASPSCLMSRSWGVKLLLQGSNFTGNAATEHGGAVYASGAALLVIEKSFFMANIAVKLGGALMCDYCGQANITHSMFFSNGAQSGGALMVVSLQQQSVILFSTVVNNSAVLDGSSILESIRSSENGIIRSSSAMPELPGPANDSSSAPLSRWPHCSDPGVAGGICITPGRGGLKLAGVTIALNQAALGGGLFVDPCSNTTGGSSSKEKSPSTLSFCGLVVDDSCSLTNNSATEAGNDLFMHDLEALKFTPSAAARRKFQGTNSGKRSSLSTIDLPTPRRLATIVPQLPPLPASFRTLSASPLAFPGPKPASKQPQGQSQHQQPPKPMISYGRDGLCLLAYSGDGAAPGLRHFVDASTIPARILMEQAGAASEMAIPINSSSGSAEVCQPLLEGSVAADREPLLLGSDSILPPVQIALQDELGSLVVSEQLVQQITVAAKAQHVGQDGSGDLDHHRSTSSRGRGCDGDAEEGAECTTTSTSSTGMVAVLEGQTQLVLNQGVASFSELELKGPPGEVFNVTFSLQQLSSGDIPLEGLAPSLLVKLPSCQPGQVIKLSSQGLPVGCVSCIAPLFAFDSRSNECLKCSTHASRCGGDEMLPNDGYFQWHPLSTQLLECPGPNACKAADREVLRAIQQHFVGMVDRGGSGATAGGVKASNNSGSGWLGRRLAQKGANGGSSSSSSELQAIYQQQQCAEGYTGPLCTGCVHDLQHVPMYSSTHLLLQNMSSASTAYSLGRRYGKFQQTCRACPANRGLSILYYLLARLVDLALIGVQVVLVVRERHKRIVKLRKQMTAKLSGQTAPPPPKKKPVGLAAKVVAANAAVKAWLQRVWPEWLRSSLALAPLMRKEQNKVPKSEELASEFVVQVLVELFQLLSLLLMLPALPGTSRTLQQTLSGMFASPLITQAWVSLDCLLPTGLQQHQVAFYNILASILLPVANACLVVIICATFLGVAYLRVRQSGGQRQTVVQAVWPTILMSLSRTLSFLYLPITSATMSLFSCRSLSVPVQGNGVQVEFVRELRWTMDYSQQCFTGIHLKYVLAAGVPSLLLLVIGFPAVQTILLRWRMPKSGLKRLEGQVWADYGALYDFYRPRLFLWGSTTEARKLLLLGLITALQAEGSAAQALAIEAGLLLIVFLEAWLMPARGRRMNMLRLACVCAVLQTVHLGVLMPLSDPDVGGWYLQVGVLAINSILVAFLGCILLQKAVVAAWRKWAKK